MQQNKQDTEKIESKGAENEPLHKLMKKMHQLELRFAAVCDENSILNVKLKESANAKKQTLETQKLLTDMTIEKSRLELELSDTKSTSSRSQLDLKNHLVDMGQERSRLREEISEKDMKIENSAAELIILAEENSNLKRVIVQQEIRFCNLQASVAGTNKQTKSIAGPAIISLDNKQPSRSGLYQTATTLPRDSEKIEAASSNENIEPVVECEPISAPTKQRITDSVASYVEFSSLANLEETVKKSTEQKVGAASSDVNIEPLVECEPISTPTKKQITDSAAAYV